MPQFKTANTNGLNQWLAQNLKYPESLKTKNKEGRVFVKFWVN